MYYQHAMDDDRNLLDSLDRIYADESENPMRMLDIASPYCDIDDIKTLLNSKSITKCHLTCLHLNIHSLPAKYDQLTRLIYEMENVGTPIDIILLCETFLRDISAVMCNIPGYTFVYKNRDNVARGGVALYIKSGIHFKQRDDLSLNVESEFESLFVEINSTEINSPNLIVGEIYRVPGTNEQASLERFQYILNGINQSNLRSVIGTDQNFDLLNVDRHTNTAELLSMFLASGHLPTILRPTRVTHSTSTLIDNLYFNPIRDNSLFVSAIINLDISDHLPILLILGNTGKKVKSGKSITFTCRPSDERTLAEISEQISRISWTRLNTLSIDDAWDFFHVTINNIIDRVAPLRQMTISSRRIIRQLGCPPDYLSQLKGWINFTGNSWVNQKITHASLNSLNSGTDIKA